MRRIEIIDEEVLIVKQSLSLYKEKLENLNSRMSISEIEVIDKLLKKIRIELNK
jgi:hypothetical protein